MKKHLDNRQAGTMGPDALRVQAPVRSWIAYLTLGISGFGIAVLAGISIHNDQKNSLTIFNMVLPVFAS